MILLRGISTPSHILTFFLSSLNDSITQSSLDISGKAYETGSINNMPYGIYRIYGTVTDLPIAASGYCSCYFRADGIKLQVFTSDTNRTFTRIKSSGSWGSWAELAFDSRLVTIQLAWDSTNGFVIPSSSPAPRNGIQLTLVGRNKSNGALYVVWYDGGSRSFRMGSVISGNAPTTGQVIEIQYLA